MLIIKKSQSEIRYYYSSLQKRIVILIVSIIFLLVGIALLKDNSGGIFSSSKIFRYGFPSFGLIGFLVTIYGIYKDFKPLKLDLVQRTITKGRTKVQFSEIKQITLTQDMVDVDFGRDVDIKPVFSLEADLTNNQKKELLEADHNIKEKYKVLKDIESRTNIKTKIDVNEFFLKSAKDKLKDIFKIK